MNFRWTQEQVDEHQKRVKGYRNRNTSASAAVESSAVDEPEKQNAPKASLQRAAIRITHYRRRLADPDSFFCKHWIDGIVDAGILPDDSAEQVTEVTHRQVKIEQWQQERTVIRLEPE